MNVISEAAYTSDVSGAKDASEAIMAISESPNSGPKVTYAISEVINAVSEVTNAVQDANSFIWLMAWNTTSKTTELVFRR